MKLIKRAAVSAMVAMCALAALGVQAAPPPVVQQIPAQAPVAVVIKDIKGFTTEISNMATRIGLPAPADMLGEAKREAGVDKGLKENGSLAVVLLETPKAEGEDAVPMEPPVLMLVPTDDPKAMIANYQPKALEQGISEITLANENQETAYVVPAGANFVAMAPQRNTLVKYLKMQGGLDKQLSPESVKAFENSDVVVYANVPAFQQEALGALTEFRQGMHFMMGMGGGGVQQQAMAKIMVDGMVDLAQQVVKDAKVGLLTMDLTDQGATIGGLANFTADSESAKVLAAQKPLQQATLKGLPDGKLMGAGRMNWDAGTAAKMIDAVTQRMTKDEAVAADAEASKRIAEYMAFQKDFSNLLQGLTFAFYAPEEQGKGLLRAVYLMDTTDAAKAEALLVKAFKDEKMMTVGTPENVKINATVNENALQIGGVKVNKYTMTFAAAEGAGDDQQVQQVLQGINMIYGEDGVVAYSGVVGNQLVMAIESQGLMEKAIASVKAGENKLGESKEITAASKHVVANPVGVAYLPVSRWMDAVKAMMMPDAEPAAEAAVLPVVMSVGASGSVMTFQVFVPTEVMKNVAEMGAMGGMQPAPVGEPMMIEPAGGM